MDYRKNTRIFLKIQFGKQYDIHHIDFNHENNNIENLLLLPKDLHQRLHKAKTDYGAFIDNEQNVFSDIKSQVSCSILSKALHEISKIYEELQIWVSMKGIYQGVFNYNLFRK